MQSLFTTAQHTIDIVAPTPPAYGAVWLVLTTLTYRITGLDRQDTPQEWEKRRDAWYRHGTFTSVPPELRDSAGGAAESNPVEEYFERYADAFFLFGDKPFLQDRRLAAECKQTSGVNKFVLGRPTGVNSATWWTRHHKDKQTPIPPAEAIWWLLVQWYYGAAGQITAREVDGKSSSSSRSGMLRGSMVYIPRGKTLFESLLRSLVPPGEAAPDPGVAAFADECPWEWEAWPSPGRPALQPGGMCALLSAVHNHSMLLVRDDNGDVADVYRTWAYRNPWPALKKIPFLSYEHSKGNTRKANPSRALWRELDALLPSARNNAQPSRDGYLPPAFLAERPDEGIGIAGLTAVAFHQDPKTVDYAWWLSQTPVALAEFLTAADENERAMVAAEIQQLLQTFDTEAWLLRSALRSAWRNGVRSGPKEKLLEAWPNRATPLFWKRAENLFYGLLSGDQSTAPAGDGSQGQHRGQRAIRALTCEIYDEVTDLVVHAETATSADYLLRRAVIRHRPRLNQTAHRK
ncbi:hypothetical protein Nans01_29960 [Nocardiopsis ansamitocini]|uniref:Type I-E CRISPR-associated protein Cse1/CasA n=1 Tax=Nocardiopsis ansamitocini TaxID=1670832 RepID=A0A9W6P7K8_9ACTN|nr:hypothetical protein Nans01_29960 [Nocardiopsis ansamitocini]